MKDKLQIAVEQIVAYLHQQGIPEHLAESIAVLEKRLAEKHREQQIEADLVAATAKYWQEHMRDRLARGQRGAGRNCENTPAHGNEPAKGGHLTPTPQPKPARGSNMKDPMAEFHSLCGGVVEVNVIDSAMCNELLTRAEQQNDLEAEHLVVAIGGWIDRVSERRNQHSCMLCSSPFLHAPSAFVVCRPFANRKAAMVSGLCHHCEHNDDIYAAIMQQLRKSWPDMGEVEAGQS
jgi:hypothetical protein